MSLTCQLQTSENYSPIFIPDEEPVIFSKEVGKAILNKLEQNHYVFIEGKSFFPDSLRESFNELANAFNNIKAEAESIPNHPRQTIETFQLARGLLYGRFDVSANYELSPNLEIKEFTFENKELYQTEPLDAYIVNNHRFYHGAKEINISEKDSVRDVLIMQIVNK